MEIRIMNSPKPFTCRRVGSQKRWAAVTAIAMLASTLGGNRFVPVVHAQTAPVGQGFVLTAGDLRFIYAQILVAQEHAAGGTLLAPGPNQVADPQLPRGLRTVDGSFNKVNKAGLVVDTVTFVLYKVASCRR